MSLYLNTDLKSYLKKLYVSTKNPIAANLINGRQYDEKADVNYLDIVFEDSTPFLTFLSNKRASELVGSGTYWVSPKRQQSRIGRIIGKLFPDISEKERTKFVDELTALIISYQAKVQLCEGEEIRQIYLETNYHADARGGTLLGGSCMRQEGKQSYLSLYVDNSDSISLAYVRRDQAISARALVWRGFKNKTPVTILDRVYFALPQDEKLILEWMKDKCDYVRMRDDNTGEVYFRKALEPAGREELIITVPLVKWRYLKYPYMDTFCFLDKDTKCLTNKKLSAVAGKSHRFMQQQDGGFTDTEGDYDPDVPEGHVFIRHSQQVVPLENARQYEDQWYQRDEFATCAVCAIEVPRHILQEVHFYGTKSYFICRPHFQRKIINSTGSNIGYFIMNGTQYSRCLHCNQYRDFDVDKQFGWCEKCYEQLATCPDCDQKISPGANKYRIYTTNTKNKRGESKKVCASCVLTNYPRCSKCNYNFTSESLVEFVLNGSKTAKESRFYCLVCANSPDIKESPYLTKKVPTTINATEFDKLPIITQPLSMSTYYDDPHVSDHTEYERDCPICNELPF